MTGSNLVYTFTAGPGELSYQSLYLGRSIKQVDAESEIVILLINSEIDRIPYRVLRELYSLGTVVVDDRPIREYPISAKPLAMKRANELTEANHILFLDSDMLALDRVDIHKQNEQDLFLVPVFNARYWGTSDSYPVWEMLYESADIPLPDERIRSTVGGEEILPYWNAGMILARSGDFAEEWLQLMKTLYPKIKQSPAKEWYTDQVSLGIISNNYDFYNLPEAYNYPLGSRQKCSGGIKHLHYHKYSYLFEIDDEPLLEFMKNIGLDRTEYRKHKIRKYKYKLRRMADKLN